MSVQSAAVSAWRDAANRAALDNISRTIESDPAPRKQRVVKGTTQAQNAPPKSATKETAAPITNKPLHVAGTPMNFQVAPSITSQDQLFFDARSYAASTVPSLSTVSEKSACSNTTRSFIAPHLRNKSRLSKVFFPDGANKAPLTSGNLAAQNSSLDGAVANGPAYQASHEHTSHYTQHLAMYSHQPPAPPSLAESFVTDSQRTISTVPKFMITSNPAPAHQLMNSGPAAKSAGEDAILPCSYKDCGMGFRSMQKLKDHKYEEHEGYCKLCDVDCEDWKALIEHKTFELRHIACEFCGKDFKSEAGRDRHHLRDHRPESNTKCAYCGMLFRGGASLLAHHLRNQCPDPRGGERKIRQYRALSALAYDKMDFDYEKSERSGAASSRLTFSDTNSVTTAGDFSDVGGVPIPSDLLDQADEDGLSDSKVPAITDVEEDLIDLSVDGKKTVVTEEWTRKFFPDAGPTPVVEGYNVPHRPMLEFNEKSAVKDRMSTTGAKMKNDWEYAEFQQDEQGDFECPFESCTEKFPTRTSIISHLCDGRHLGTELSCPHCRRRFDVDRKLLKRARFSHHSPHGLPFDILNERAMRAVPAVVRLISHMESSNSCTIKKSDRFGHWIHIYSGGFLQVMHDEWDRPFLLEAEDPTPEPAAVLHDHPEGEDW